MNPEPAQREKSDVDIRGIVVFVIALIVAGVVIHGAVWVMYRYFEKQASQPSTVEWGRQVPSPVYMLESIEHYDRALADKPIACSVACHRQLLGRG